MATSKVEMKLRDLTVKVVNAVQDGIEDGDLKPQGRGLTLPAVALDDGTVVKIWMDWPLTKQQWAEVAREVVKDASDEIPE